MQNNYGAIVRNVYKNQNGANNKNKNTAKNIVYGPNGAVKKP